MIKHLITNKYLLCIIVCILALLPNFSTIIFSPNSYLFSSNGDGIKAYYVYASHIKYDNSYHQFNNMNYPYGQTYIYTDGEPAIANIVKFIASIFPALGNYSIGIYNILLLISFPLCAILLLNIATRIGIKKYYAVFAAVAITIMSPQVYRLIGHLTLSYLCFFPMLWVLLYNFFENPNARNTLLIIINGLFWGFVHPYFGFIQTLFLMATYAYLYIFYKNNSFTNKRIYILTLLQIVMPISLIKLYSDIVDIHNGRSNNPTGFYDYIATWKSVFLPTSEKSYQYIEPYFGPIKDAQWEGWAYGGIIVDIAIVLFVLNTVINLFKFKFNDVFKNNLPIALKYTLWPSIAVLLFAMGIPFIFTYKLSRIPEYIPFIKQFRALGRFTWPFYFIASMYGFYYFYNLHEKLLNKGKKYLSYGLVSIITFFVIAECSVRQLSIADKMTISTNVFTKEGFQKAFGNTQFVKNTNYQAIIPLPFFHIGSENFNAHGTDLSLRLAFAYSYHTNIPLIASSAARTPINEAKNIMQLFAPDYFKKNITGLNSTKPILILYTGEPLDTAENKLLKKSTFFYKSSYSLGTYIPYFDYQSASDKEWRKYITDTINHAKKPILFKGYEESYSNTTFEGKGAYVGEKKQFNQLANNLELNLDTSQTYVVSFWYYNNDELINNNMFVIEECDKEVSNCAWEHTYSLDKAQNIVGNWTLYEFYFKPKKTSAKINLFTKSFDELAQYIYIDNLMLRKAENTVYRVLSGNNGKIILYKNNYLIGKN